MTIAQMSAADQDLPMGEAEARACVHAINGHLDGARTLLLDLYEREGWRALGYSSWRQCVIAEFDQSISYLYRLLATAKLERDVSPIGDNTAHLSEWHARQILSLPEAERRPVIEELALGLSPRRLQDLAKQKRDGHPHLRLVQPAETSTPLPGCVQLEQADAAHLPWDDGRVDLWVTSPPYCLGISEAGYVDYSDYTAYLQLAARWAAEMYRVGAPWARLALNVAIDITRPREPLAADWVQVLRAAGWQYRTTILWKEGNISRGTARGSLDSPGAINVICPAEVVLVFHKGEWNLATVRQFRPEWGRPDLSRQEWLDWTMASWSFAGEKAKLVGGYPGTFPSALTERSIKLFSFPGAAVGDPFVGSGTTAVVGAQLGRRVYASDISPSAVELAHARVAPEVSDGYR